MTIRVLDPTSELISQNIRPAERLSSLEGKTVGFISNGKQGTKGYFTHLDSLLRRQFKVADVVWRNKSNYSAPAEQVIIDEAMNWDLAITGIGD